MTDVEYSLEWFKERAIKSLSKINDTTWDYSDSLLLYTPDGDVGYENIQASETLYHKLVTAPERIYLQHSAQRIVSALPNRFLYVDLGPGTEHKEQFIFDEAKKQGKEIVYAPVDISDRYLQIASEYAAQLGISVTPIRVPFEEVAQQLSENDLPRFVSLGLTYGNYAPKDILTLMRTIMGVTGFGFISAQIRDRVSMPELVKAYTEAIYGFLDAKAALLGLDPMSDIAQRRIDDRIQGWYTIQCVSAELKEAGVREGDTLLMFRTLRPTEDEYRKSVREVLPNSEFLDDGGSFIGTLLQA